MQMEIQAFKEQPPFEDLSSSLVDKIEIVFVFFLEDLENCRHHFFIVNADVAFFVLSDFLDLKNNDFIRREYSVLQSLSWHLSTFLIVRLSLL